MGNYRCFECGNASGNWMYYKSRREYKGNGYCFGLDVETPYCEKCGSPIYDKETEQEIREKANAIIRERTGIISREEILELVKYYGVSQKYLSKVLGWGEITLPRYIKGNYSPNLENSNKLKSIKNPYVLLKLVEENIEENIEGNIEENIEGNVEKNIADREDSLKEKLLRNINGQILSIEIEKGKMYKAIDWFLNNTSEENRITHLALQKILYFVQAWSYVLNGEWMFDEECEAWTHGAVYSVVYDDFKYFKHSQLPQLKTNSSLSDEEVNILKFVKENYLDIYNAKTLEKICHLEEPFKNARGNIDESARSKNIISKESIARYYKTIAKNYSIDKDNLSNIRNYLNDIVYN